MVCFFAIPDCGAVMGCCELLGEPPSQFPNGGFLFPEDNFPPFGNPPENCVMGRTPSPKTGEGVSPGRTKIPHSGTGKGISPEDNFPLLGTGLKKR